jgi:hypothetical protein
MAIKVTCPRCNTALQVPAKLLGQYTQCPACQNRILIPPHVPPAAASESAASRNTPPGRSAQPATGTDPRSAHAAPAAVWSDHAAAEPAPQRKVARFITAESAPSTVHLAPNGELPKLQLAESAQSGRGGPKTSNMNPLVLVGGACLSFCMCVILLLSDFDPPSVNSQQEAGIRSRIEAYYKNQEGPLEPYQTLLRDAQQARSRGDRQTEQSLYRKVLNLLHAEREPRDRFRGLTGTPKNDQDLEKLLVTLLTGQPGEISSDGN